MLGKDVNEMSIEELKQEVIDLRRKYVWGLQVEDFAMSLIGSTYDDLDIRKTEVYSMDELTNEDLRTKVYQELSNSNFSMHEWDSTIQLHEYSEETLKLLKTMAFRQMY